MGANIDTRPHHPSQANDTSVTQLSKMTSTNRSTFSRVENEERSENGMHFLSMDSRDSSLEHSSHSDDLNDSTIVLCEEHDDGEGENESGRIQVKGNLTKKQLKKAMSVKVLANSRLTYSHSNIFGDFSEE